MTDPDPDLDDITPAPEPPVAPEGVFSALGLSSLKRITTFLLCVIASLVVVGYVPIFAELDTAPRRALFILVLAALLWVTDAIAAFSVGILVIALNIALLGNPRNRPFVGSDRDWEEFVLIIGHPLVWLFFGGFVLAAGLARVGLDRRLASSLMKRLGTRPTSVLFGIMAITFTLSMFMSNTATTAMMIALLGPLTMRLDRRFATGLLLGTAVAANLGGMGSLIGTPPNAIAVGALSQLDDPVDISFVQWMAIGLPLGAVLSIVAGLIIAKLYPAEHERLPTIDWSSDDDQAIPLWQALVVAITFAATVGLWMTSQWHHTPTAVVSFLPIVVFTTTGILDTKAMRGLPYDVLFLLAGGLALGQAMTTTGLADWIVSHIPTEGLGVMGVALVVSIVTLILSNFMSNTAASNILIPLSVSMVVGAEARVAVPIALSASAAMCLPIATPPNAMVFAAGGCSTRDFLRMGAILGVLTPVLAVLWSSVVLKWLGL